MLPEHHLDPHVDLLRVAFPQGLDDDERLSLLFLLQDAFSERNLAYVGSQLCGVHPAYITHDAITVLSQPPPPEVVERIRARLDEVEWDWDAE